MVNKYEKMNIPKFYNVLLENGRRLKYRRDIITTLFSFFELKEIIKLSKVSRRMYYITGLKEVLIHFRKDTKEDNCGIANQSIGNTVIIDRT
mmetsp:Transcript_6785/g.5932  ORF Transcript_6785/g.5932 Transcript_6785/m.5932 type:complete len:92 (-) Transcript_6785:678-953(-)